MEKGKLGVTMKFYAVLAFVLALFGQTLLCGLLLALVLVVEKEEWASRQCMQAFFLTFVSAVGSAIASAFTVFGSSGSWLTAALLSPLYIIGSVISGIFSLVVLIFAIIGLVNVAKGREANVPLLSGWAYKAFGYVQQKTQPQPAPQYPYGAYPQQGQPMPQQPTPPMGQPMPQPMQPPVDPYAPGAGQPPVPPNTPMG